MAHHDLIEEAFNQDAELARRINSAMRETPTSAPLYIDIAKYIRRLRNDVATGRLDSAQHTEISFKKRKLEHGTGRVEAEAEQEHRTKVIFESKNLSFSIPFRKKLHLEIAQDVSPRRDKPASAYQVRARNPASGELEYKVGLQSFSNQQNSILAVGKGVANSELPEHALRLPVPEKAQRQFNFVLIPEFGLGIGDKPPTIDIAAQDPLVWTINESLPKVTTSTDPYQETAISVGEISLVEQNLDRCLKKAQAGKIVQPEDAEFASATPESHRKGEKSYHVKAFRGSKDGYLFFLATGIFFGFKRPLAFFPFEVINSISYTSVLQRTFNLNIAVQLPEQQETKEHEFSMLDQADFAGIDAYIKRHGLQDASLAESRKARRLNLNGARKGVEKSTENEGEDQSELQRAQQGLSAAKEDEEDDEEEDDDYDPGSEDLSDGSGESSEDEENGKGDAAQSEQDLVTTELGSEAENVVPDPDDEDQL